MAGKHVTGLWNGRTIRLWVPSKIADMPLRLTERTVRHTERTAAELKATDRQLPEQWARLSRLSLRHEGIASSGIEGLAAPIADVLHANLVGHSGDTAGWVADNLQVLDLAIAQANDSLTPRMMHEWHGKLMANSSLDRYHRGCFRASIGWVGGNSPVMAAYIPPPPEMIPVLVDDLCDFTERSGYDGITIAAIAHAQFEAIHPYADGNGRLGRTLMAYILKRAGLTRRCHVPLSAVIAADPGGYLSGLHLYQQADTGVDTWVCWVSRVARRAAGLNRQLMADTLDLLESWRQQTSDLRANHTARRLLRLLPSQPLVNSRIVAQHLGVGHSTARLAIQHLAGRGILKPYQPSAAAMPNAAAMPSATGRPVSWYIAEALAQIWTV